jgi:hypothetical protein
MTPERCFDRRMSPRLWVASAEAVAALLVARATLALLPFRLTARLLGRAVAAGNDAMALSDRQRLRARGVGVLVDRAAGRLPWGSSCLVRVLAARLLLLRRGIPAVARFGVGHRTGFAAHAWLLVGGEAIVGGAEAESFRPIADFRRGE